MKQIGLVILVVALTGLGCTPNPYYVRDDMKPPPVQLKEAPPTQPVSPEGITAQNAAEKIEQLRAEMKRDAKMPGKPAAENE